MIVSLLKKINDINEFLFAPIDGVVQKLPFDSWAQDAIVDSIHLLPFLFIVFVIIEFLEFKYSHIINSSIVREKKRSVLISSFASIFPQCGFSVMASSLYSKKIITRGCLIAVYLGTSDECLPILLAHPEKMYLVVPVVLVKFVVALIAGYFLDFIWGNLKNLNKPDDEKILDEHITEEGCCNHSPECTNKKELIIHPIVHTVNIFSFILVITLILNYFLEHLSFADILIKNTNSFLMCMISSLIGLIPNCAISIAITMMLIKGHITFGVALSGLLANSGLGLLVLLKNNDFKDNIKIVAILLMISIATGFLLDLCIANFVR